MKDLRCKACKENNITKTHELIVSNDYGYMVKLPNETQQSPFYLSAPVNSNLVILDSLVIFWESSDLLINIFQSFDISLQRVASWTCQRKDFGLLRASCCQAGLPSKSNGTGQPTKPSRRTGFTA